MNNKKEFLCDSCRFADIQIIEVYRPIYASSSLVNKVEELTIWCKDKYVYVRKLPTFRDRKKCNYKVKAGKVGKKLYQKQIGEN